MEFGQLLALPRQSLVLLASVRHFVTTDSKVQLAERLAHLSMLSHHLLLPSTLQTMLFYHSCRLTRMKLLRQKPPFLRCRSPSCDRSSRQPFKTNVLALNIPRFWSKDHSFLLRLHSPNLHRRPSTLVYKILRSSRRTTLQQVVGSSSTPGPNPTTAYLVETPGTSAPAHNLSPLPQNILLWIIKREDINFADLPSGNLYPHPSLTAQNQYKL